MHRKGLIILGLVLLTACSQIPSLWQQTIYEVPSGSILFQEDFSTEENGWQSWDQDGSFVRYQAEGLHFFVNQANYDYRSTPGYTFKDVKIEVDAIKVGGPDNNAYGVICRFVDAENYYAFLMSSDGYAGLLRVLDGDYTLLNANSMEYAPVILQGEALNKISVICAEDELSFMINGELMFEVQDQNFETGDVGLMVSSYDQPGVDILFDNLTVSQP
jgi:hypothetical protein